MTEMIIYFMCFANTVAIYLMHKRFSEQVNFQTQRDIALLENSRKLMQLALEEKKPCHT